MHEAYVERVRPFLQEGEEIAAAENVVCVATGSAPPAEWAARSATALAA